MGMTNHSPSTIDLTYPLSTGMPVYPGTPPPEIQPFARFAQEGFRERRLTFCSHTGTHMDAPSHLLDDGKTLDQFTVDRFIGKGLCIDCTGKGDGVLDRAWLQRYQDQLIGHDFLVLRTGWGKHWATPSYFHGYPVLTEPAADYLTSFDLMGIGVDTLSVDHTDADHYPIHHILLRNNILIIENLAHLRQLPEGSFGQICCLPLHILGSDGAPTRVVARLNNGEKV